MLGIHGPRDARIGLDFDSRKGVVFEFRADRYVQPLTKQSKLILSEAAEQVPSAAIWIQTDNITRDNPVLGGSITQSPYELVAFGDPDVVLKVNVVDRLMIHQQPVGRCNRSIGIELEGRFGFRERVIPTAQQIPAAEGSIVLKCRVVRRCEGRLRQRFIIRSAINVSLQCIGIIGR